MRAEWFSYRLACATAGAVRRAANLVLAFLTWADGTREMGAHERAGAQPRCQRTVIPMTDREVGTVAPATGLALACTVGVAVLLGRVRRMLTQAEEAILAVPVVEADGIGTGLQRALRKTAHTTRK